MPCVQKMVFLGSLPSTRGSLPSTRNEWKNDIVVWKWNSCGWKWIWHRPSESITPHLQKTLESIVLETVLMTITWNTAVYSHLEMCMFLCQMYTCISPYYFVHIIMIYFVLMICYGMIYSLVMCIVLSVKLYSLVINFSCAWLRVCYVEVKV